MENKKISKPITLIHFVHFICAPQSDSTGETISVRFDKDTN